MYFIRLLLRFSECISLTRNPIGHIDSLIIAIYDYYSIINITM